MKWPLKFGIFAQPLRDAEEDPTAHLERDLQLIEFVDALGYDEFWIGEHHSGGWELVSSPEIMVATAAARTRHIRLGTGVTSVTYHHPLIVADNLCLLDHLTRGRVMLGVGPGALASDAWMMGIDPLTQRRRMEESLECIVALLRGEVVTRETEWFTLCDARLQLLPYSFPCFEIAVASLVSPSGGRLAGRLGTSLLSMAATTTAATDVLASSWAVAEEQAELAGTTVDRRGWRLVGPMHIAETEEQAWRDVAHGLERWAWYFTKVTPMTLIPTDGTLQDMIKAATESGFAVIGTPEQAIAQIQRLHDRSGGFGTFLFMDHDWASREAKLRSYDLVARHVFPAFKGSTRSRIAAQDWAIASHSHLSAQALAARAKASEDYQAEKATQQGIATSTP